MAYLRNKMLIYQILKQVFNQEYQQLIIHDRKDTHVWTLNKIFDNFGCTML